MFPLFLPGDKVLLEKSKVFAYGDIVAYLEGTRLTAHRIVYVSPDRKHFVTKGDNNIKVDARITKEDILGTVTGLKRGINTIKLKHLYYAQSSFYLTQLVIVDNIFGKAKIKYIILRGIVPHLFWAKEPPNRLLADCDIYVKPVDFDKAVKALLSGGFVKLPSALLGKGVRGATEVTLQKNTLPYPVRVDLHRGLGIPFTKLTHLNSLFPKIKDFEANLFQETIKAKAGTRRFPILKKETLLIYLLLHWYRHNFEGTHRMELGKILIDSGVDWKKVEASAKKYGFGNVISLGLALSKKYFGADIPLNVDSPILTFISPLQAGNRVGQGIKRLILALVLSPKDPVSKTTLLLSPKTLKYVLPALLSLFGSLSKSSTAYITQDYASHLDLNSKTRAIPS